MRFLDRVIKQSTLVAHQTSNDLRFPKKKKHQQGRGFFGLFALVGIGWISISLRFIGRTSSVFLAGMIGFCWVCLGFPKCYRVVLGFDEFQTVSMGYNGFFLSFNGFQWVSMGFTGFYWVFLGFTGLNSGFTGFYRVLLGFTGFS